MRHLLRGEVVASLQEVIGEIDRNHRLRMRVDERPIGRLAIVLGFKSLILIEICLHLSTSHFQVLIHEDVIIRNKDIRVSPSDGIGRPVVLAHQFEIVGHQRTGERVVEVPFQFKLSSFRPAISYLRRISRIGMATKSYGITIREIHLALDDKSSLNLGAHGEATQAEREYKKYLVHFTI